MIKPRCLIVDDEADLRELALRSLLPLDIECLTAKNLEEAYEILNQHGDSIDFSLVDIRLPDGNGLDFVKAMQQVSPQTHIAVVTAYDNHLNAQAVQAGASDFLNKPIDLGKLRTLVRNALKAKEEKGLNLFSNRSTKILDRFTGKSASIDAVKEKVKKIARGQAPVYIRGESGSGKEVIARIIHDLSPRHEQDFVPVNCGAIPNDLMESEFFGYKKGAFTGALYDKQGLFQIANKGTLFLDEVAELPLHMQVKLLRAIQENQIRPLGSHQEIPVDVRILSASHRDLSSLVREGKFREDLFYRINVIELCIPPLREHPEDIAELVNKILNTLTSSPRYHFDDGSPLQISEKAMKALLQYDFPGNVRELENILERAATLCEKSLIQIDDLQLPNRHIAEQMENRLDPRLDGIEKATILDALTRVEWNKTHAAKLLGISLSKLRYRMQRLNLKDKP
ncbi:MAG: sigma-54 dependent transcriptional regulator [Thiotrichaceae bacterium]|nr:sigma-54 dependent transcriptional regulator [Thiotrichaceae bacterium]